MKISHTIGHPVRMFDQYLILVGWKVRCSCGWLTKAPLSKMVKDDALLHLELDDV